MLTQYAEGDLLVTKGWAVLIAQLLDILRNCNFEDGAEELITQLEAIKW